MKRRDFLALSTVVAASALITPGFMRTAGAASKELRVLTWEGYADDQWVKAFEKKTGASVSVTYAASVDEIFAKLTASQATTSKRDCFITHDLT